MVSQKTFDLDPKRKTGVPDEVMPILVLKAGVEGSTYVRRIALWDGEARETPAFQSVRQALHALADSLAK